MPEKRRPQDGRIKTRMGAKGFDLRVSILPTNHGQAVVMRILDRDNIKITTKSGDTHYGNKVEEDGDIGENEGRGVRTPPFGGFLSPARTLCAPW